MRVNFQITETRWYFTIIPTFGANHVVATYDPKTNILTIVKEHKKYLPHVITLLNESLNPTEKKLQVILEWYREVK